MRKNYLFILLVLVSLQLQAQLLNPDELYGFRTVEHELQQVENLVFISVMDDFGGSFLFVFDAEKQKIVAKDWTDEMCQPLVKDDKVFVLERRYRESRFDFQVRDTGLNILSIQSVPDSLTQRRLFPVDAQIKGDTLLYAFGSEYPLFDPGFSLLRFSVNGSFIDQVDLDTNLPFGPLAFTPKNDGYWIFTQPTDTVIKVHGERSYAALLDVDDTLGLRSVHPIEQLRFPGFSNAFDVFFEKKELYLDGDDMLCVSGSTIDYPGFFGTHGYLARINVGDSVYSDKQLFTAYNYGKTSLMSHQPLSCNETEQVLFYNTFPYQGDQMYGMPYPSSYVTFCRLDDAFNVIEEEDFFYGNQRLNFVESAVLTDAGKLVAVGNERDSLGAWRTFIMTMDCNGQLLDVSYVDEPKQRLQVYPNPTKDICTIQASSEVLEVVVIDLNGSVVLRASTSQLDMGALPSGMYSVHVTTANGSFTEKVVRE